MGELCSDVGDVERLRDIVTPSECRTGQARVDRRAVDGTGVLVQAATERYGVAALVASAKVMVIEATSVVLMVDSGVLVMGSESEWKG